MQRCPTPAPWLLYIFLDRGQDLERAKSSAAINLRRIVHVFSADGPWATGRGLLRADFCRSALFFCVEGAQGCHCFSWELSLACRAPGTRAKCMHSKVLKICTNVKRRQICAFTYTYVGGGWGAPGPQSRKKSEISMKKPLEKPKKPLENPKNCWKNFFF